MKSFFFIDFNTYHDDCTKYHGNQKIPFISCRPVNFSHQHIIGKDIICITMQFIIYSNFIALRCHKYLK